MKIVEIRESGANNLLMYSLKHNASLKNDRPLVSLINDELFYLVTISDVSFFELFRLTQMYRAKLRLLSSEQAGIPTDEELQGYFVGESMLQGENVSHSELARHSVQLWLHLVMQMSSDNDLINEGAARLFIPMLARKFTVQIPVGFYDFFGSMSGEEVDALFNDRYPETLMDIITATAHGVKTTLSMGIVKGTQIVRYDKRYDNYLKQIKYFPLNADINSTKLYKLGLLGFSKRDPIARTEVRFSLFKVNKDAALNTMKRLSKLNTPLEVDFVVQLPIEYMQLLLNSYDPEILPVQYESSMSHILDSGIRYDDFKTVEVTQEAEDAEKVIEEHENVIAAYRVRIAEANETMLKAIQTLMESKNEDITTSAIFSLLPTIYNATAVITVSSEHLKTFMEDRDPVIHSLFEDIATYMGRITEDLRNARDI